MSFIETLTEHFKELGQDRHFVPSWGPDGTWVHFTPFTPTDRANLRKVAKNEDDLVLLVIEEKSLDEAGKPLFKMGDRGKFKNLSVWSEIDDLFDAIWRNRGEKALERERTKKNHSADPEETPVGSS